jgi:drug/metabolite transporter (DMT)-like permease
LIPTGEADNGTLAFAVISAAAMWFGILSGLAASASWAAANVFVQRSGRALGSARAVAWTLICGGLALAPIAWLLEEPSGILDLPTIVWASIGGLAGTMAYGCLFYSTERGRLSIVIPVTSAWSVISAAISIGILGETVKGKHLIGAGLVVAGVIVVSRFSVGAANAQAQDGEQKSRARRTLLAAAGAAVGFGVMIPAIDQVAPVAGRLGAIPIVCLLSLVFGLPLALARGGSLRPPSKATWPVVAAAGLFEMFGFVAIAFGVSRAPIAVVSPLAGLASAFTVLYAWIVLRERPARPALLGAALACAGVVTLAL